MYRTHGILVIAVLLVIMAAGCSQETRTALKNKAVVTQALKAMDDREYDRFGEFFAQDVKRHSQATPDVEVNSLDEMIAFARMWYEAFPDMKAETHLIVAEGDLVAVWGTYVGTHQGPMGDIPATGKRMESETFGFFRVEDGKIAEFWVTWDNLAAMKQLGLMPPEAEKPSGDM